MSDINHDQARQEVQELAGLLRRYQYEYYIEGRPSVSDQEYDRLFDRLAATGCEIARLRLDVGVGTFKPVSSDDIRAHTMHSETFTLSEETAIQLNRARENDRRIIAVGTTSLRTLETCCDADRRFAPATGATDIFIHPPRRIRSIDALITNFHLPRSTLLMLVAAWIGPAWRALYDEAKRKGYRFYSYGDAMLLD